MKSIKYIFVLLLIQFNFITFAMEDTKSRNSVTITMPEVEKVDVLRYMVGFRLNCVRE